MSQSVSVIAKMPGISPPPVHSASHSLRFGWLIRRQTAGDCDQPLYLQIGTGQWCAAQYATLFPLRRTAVTYAIDFGYSPGETAEIVPFAVD